MLLVAGKPDRRDQMGAELLGFQRTYVTITHGWPPALLLGAAQRTEAARTGIPARAVDGARDEPGVAGGAAYEVRGERYAEWRSEEYGARASWRDVLAVCG
jgi:hypothetical protein